MGYQHFEIDDETIVRWPVPFELGHVFQSIPVGVLDAWYQKDPGLVTEVLGESLRQANPVDWPAGISPVIDAIGNRDFAGRPIVPRSVAGKLAEDQYKPHTTELMKLLGKGLDLSPAQIEHVVDSYSGGLYGRVARSIELLSEQEGEVERIKADLPVIGTLFMRDPYAPKKSIEEFYDRLDELDRMHQSQVPSDEATGFERMRYITAGRVLSQQWKILRETEDLEKRKAAYERVSKWITAAEGNE